MDTALDLQQVLSLLLEATHRDKLQWRPTEIAAEDSFQAPLAGGFVRLARTVYRPTYLVQFFEEKEKLVREYEPFNDSDRYTITQLFYDVRGRALNLHQIEQRLIGDLIVKAGKVPA